ncbi:MAG: O-antigen ligase family protein [Alphaproteobacteria bacterium]|nr:O-antigen ligase family protein [Alphaproteobacteria bacterium]
MGLTIQKIYEWTLVLGLCLMPVMAVFAPRALGIAPMVLGLIAFILHRIAYKNWPWPGRGFTFLAVGVVALGVFSSLWAVDGPQALDRAGKLAAIFLGGGLLWGTTRGALSHSDIIKVQFLKFMPWAALVATALCAFELYSRGMFYALTHPDLHHFNPAFLNRSTVFCVLCFWPAFYTVQHAGRSDKNILMILLGLAMAALLYKADSQSAQLAFLVSAPFYFLFPAARREFWAALGVCLLAGIAAAPWIAALMFEHGVVAVQDITWFQRSFAANRMEIWDFVARRALESPFWGHGLEATRVITDFDTQKLYFPENTVLHPHNFALQIWIEFGFIGVSLLSAALGWFLLQIRRLPVLEARLSLAVFMAALSVASTGYGLWQSWWVGGLCVLACLSLCAQHATRR